MKIIAKGPRWIASGPEFFNVQIRSKGKTWRFDYDEWLGPLWLCADGFTARKNQNVPKCVWNAFGRWYRNRNKSKT